MDQELEQDLVCHHAQELAVQRPEDLAAAALVLQASINSGGGMVHVGPGVEPVSGLI